LAATATIPTFLPVLAERFARQRLQALAAATVPAGARRPTVLFLCTHNTGRSQMALALFTHLADNTALAWSAGTSPDGQIPPTVTAALHERGIDVTREFAKPLTDEVLSAVDVVITMGCGDACPIHPGTRCEEWDLPDPATLDLTAVRRVRDAIEVHVRALLTDLHPPK
jgi:arsenate reductase